MRAFSRFREIDGRFVAFVEPLSEGPGAARGDVPPGDRLEETWRNMPETSLVQSLVAVRGDGRWR